MKYFSSDQIQESLRNLTPYNAFFSITFLVLKKAKIPINSKKRLILNAENRKFLKEHFKVHPKSNYFFRVMRQNVKTKDWVEPNYASTGLQAVNTQTFRDALLHEKNDNTWGWSVDYVQQLAAKLPRRGLRIPLFDLAVWLYKDLPWEDEISTVDVIGKIISEYGLTQEELNNLFQTDIVSEITEDHAFQELPVKWHQILAAFSQPKDVPAEASGILTYLETEAIGPVSRLVFQPGKRLNLITGDNGLGKTFLLDLSWWALTQNWADRPATPFHESPSKPALIKFAVGGIGESRPVRATQSSTGNWEIKGQRTALSGLVVYAQVDGSFGVWDPANPMLAGEANVSRWSGLKFTREEIWDGKKGQIEGLINDWTKWQLRPDRYPAYSTFKAVLSRLLPPDIGPITIGEPVRIPGDTREIPTLVHPYDSVPIFFESAGIRRILTLVYLLVWAWEEHKVQAKQQGRTEERQMVVLIDEIEAHLHPKWQRVILPALLGVAQDLHAEMAVQWVVASHSPLVLASGESSWDTETDRLFHLDMSKNGKVFFKSLKFEKRGTIDSWLSSDIFEILQPGAPDRESAIEEALRLQQLPNPTKADVQAVTTRLREHLSNEDPFWVRWIFFAESFGVKS